MYTYICIYIYIYIYTCMYLRQASGKRRIPNPIRGFSFWYARGKGPGVVHMYRMGGFLKDEGWSLTLYIYIHMYTGWLDSLKMHTN